MLDGDFVTLLLRRHIRISIHPDDDPFCQTFLYTSMGSHIQVNL